MAELSKSQIDKLGERLRGGHPTEEDLRLLEDYKRSFAPPFEEVVQKLRARSFSPVGRPEKSTLSIMSKLQRGTMKLSRMQDITGCRILVDDIAEQNRAVKILQMEFPDAITMDRRTKPSHGYRAVHLVVSAQGRHLEIQVRTYLQHRWADLSQKLADGVDSAIKYGGGPVNWQTLLFDLSITVAEYENLEIAYSELLPFTRETEEVVPMLARVSVDNSVEIDELATRLIRIREIIAKSFDDVVRSIPDRKEQ
jgi:putative GTP pyrophosphokinase